MNIDPLHTPLIMKYLATTNQIASLIKLDLNIRISVSKISFGYIYTYVYVLMPVNQYAWPMHILTQYAGYRACNFSRLCLISILLEHNTVH